MKKKKYTAKASGTSNKKKHYSSTPSTVMNNEIANTSTTEDSTLNKTFFEETPDIEEELNKFIDDYLGKEQNGVNLDRFIGAPLLNIAGANNAIFGAAAQMNTLDANTVQDPFGSPDSNQQSQNTQTNENCQNTQSNQQTTPTYIYDFTNSEFFAFIASLTPVEFIVFETVISIVIAINLNLAEKQILAGLLVDIGVTLGNLVEQQAFQEARKKEKQAIIDRKAFLDRQNKMQAEIEALQKKVQELISRNTKK